MINESMDRFFADMYSALYPKAVYNTLRGDYGTALAITEVLQAFAIKTNRGGQEIIVERLIRILEKWIKSDFAKSSGISLEDVTAELLLESEHMKRWLEVRERIASALME